MTDVSLTFRIGGLVAMLLGLVLLFGGAAYVQGGWKTVALLTLTVGSVVVALGVAFALAMYLKIGP